MSITIGGVAISGSHSSIIISKGNITIDGIDVTPNTKEINISITGDVSSLKVDDCEKISITGNAGTVSLVNGSITIDGDVSNGVSSVNGPIACQNVVSGDVSTINGCIQHIK